VSNYRGLERYAWSVSTGEKRVFQRPGAFSASIIRNTCRITYGVNYYHPRRADANLLVYCVFWQSETWSLRNPFFANDAVAFVASCFAYAATATVPNAFAVPLAANKHGGSKGVRPIAVTRRPNVDGKPTGFGNESTAYAGSEFA
jgi:hypothetical protein